MWLAVDLEGSKELSRASIYPDSASLIFPTVTVCKGIPITWLR